MSTTTVDPSVQSAQVRHGYGINWKSARFTDEQKKAIRRRFGEYYKLVLAKVRFTGEAITTASLVNQYIGDQSESADTQEASNASDSLNLVMKVHELFGDLRFIQAHRFMCCVEAGNEIAALEVAQLYLLDITDVERCDINLVAEKQVILTEITSSFLKFPQKYQFVLARVYDIIYGELEAEM